MKIFKKVLSILMASVMTITSFAVTSSAASIEDTAVKITSGKTYSTYISNYKDYEISIKQNGYLNLSFISTMQRVDVYVYDNYGNELPCIKLDVKTGEAKNWSNGSGYVLCEWNRVTEKFSGKLKYEIKKGTYYIRFKVIGDGTENKLSFSATFPSSSSSSSAKISYLSLTIPQNSSIQLGAILSAKSSSSVKWSSSKSSVASVSSKGKVTAKKKGSAVITAKLDSSSIKIKINVK